MLTRRHLLCCGAAAGLFTSLAGPARAGLLNPCRPGLPEDLRPLVARTFDGLDPTQLWDVHTHLLGTGDAGSGCSVNAQLSQWWHPLEMLRKRFILNAACVPADAPSVDCAYVERLRALADEFPAGARWMLFAFDQACDELGRPEVDKTTFHVPNDYAARIAAEHAQRFAWAASIHPYRPDALARLDAALANGAVALKWLPSSMAIDLDRKRPREAQAFDLFARLMDEDWGGQLLGDVSVVLQANRRPEVARTLFTREDWHPRLLHGSDYPLPGIPAAVRLPALVRAGLLDAADAPGLARLREHNPLLFDLALKRLAGWRGAGFTAPVFATRAHFDRRAVA